MSQKAVTWMDSWDSFLFQWQESTARRKLQKNWSRRSGRRESSSKTICDEPHGSLITDDGLMSRFPEKTIAQAIVAGEIATGEPLPPKIATDEVNFRCYLADRRIIRKTTINGSKFRKLQILRDSWEPNWHENWDQ